MTPYEKALCESARMHERDSIVANLDEQAAAIRKNGEGYDDPHFNYLAADRTRYIADQITRGVL